MELVVVDVCGSLATTSFLEEGWANTANQADEHILLLIVALP